MSKNSSIMKAIGTSTSPFYVGDSIFTTGNDLMWSHDYTDNIVNIVNTENTISYEQIIEEIKKAKGKLNVPTTMLSEEVRIQPNSNISDDLASMLNDL